ncbi:MAG: glycosyltransferase [Bdellovibrionaceae bacterium]|nr:glycosyltransferase [Pseudobdellovibrionaceae bacterium]
MTDETRSLDLTVSIVTSGRLPLLKRCLRSVADSLPLRAEILLVVNGADRQTIEWLSNNPVPGLYWEQRGRGSLASHRNFALSIARGRIFYCLDDDVEVPEFLFAEVLRFFDEHPDVGVLGGPNKTPVLSSRNQKLFGAVMTSWFAAPWVRRRYGAGGGESLADFDLMFCNLAFRAAALPPRLRFVETLRSNEENTFVSCCTASGIKHRFIDAFYVYHERRAYLSGFLKQIASYGHGRSQQIRLGWTWSQAGFLVPPAVFALAANLLATGSLQALATLTAIHQLLAFCSVVVGRDEIRALPVTQRISLVPLIGLVHLAYGFGFWRGILLGSPRVWPGLKAFPNPAR